MKFKLKDYTWITIIVWVGLMTLGVLVLATQHSQADHRTIRPAATAVHTTAG